MKALLLAAGLGTRLRPITDNIPKCLVPINGKPLLQFWLENLSKIGINEFIINTHYYHDKVETFVENSLFKKYVTLTYEKKLLNTGGTILANKKYFETENVFMLIHADNLSFCDFNDFIKAHKNRPEETEITMMLFKTDTPSNCGIVELNNEGIVEKFHEKVQNPPSNLANAAVYICNYSIIKFMEKLNKKDIDFSNDVLPNYMGKINTYLNNTYHRDIGTVESYAISQIEVLNHI